LNAIIGCKNSPDPTAALNAVADAKVLQWADEARRLKAPELREYIAPRRQTLLLAVIRHARFYRPDRKDCYSCLDPLFSGTVNWSLIQEHYDLFMHSRSRSMAARSPPLPSSPASTATVPAIGFP
jgi:hypothetical protein